MDGDLDGTLVFFVFHLLLELSTLDLLVGSHVRIEDLPLGGLKREVGLNGRVSLDTALLQGKIEGLARAFLVVELVTEGLFLGEIISSHYI